MRIEIRNTTLSDVDYVARHLRDGDRQEVEALGLSYYRAVYGSFIRSEVCLTGIIEGEPAIIFGISGDLFSNTASVWALGTDGCDKAPVSMVKVGRRVINEFLKIYPELTNYSDARYHKSHRWLKALGFTIDNPTYYGVFKLPFCRISIKRAG